MAFFWLSEEAFLRDFAGDIEPSKARALYAVQEPGADALPSTKTTTAAWQVKPTWYQVSTQDRTIDPDLERFLAKRMKATTIELESSHLSLIAGAAAPAPPGGRLLATAFRVLSTFAAGFARSFRIVRKVA
jgi:hypothetical protein